MSPKPLFKRVAIIGVGLIGGSMGLAIQQKSLVKETLGIGRNPQKLQMALEHQAVQGVSMDFNVLTDCDLVVLGTPINTTIRLLTEIAPYLSPGTLVTDVGSTKVQIVKESHIRLPKDVIFIGGHPMAGSEKGGVSGADPYLFENAFYVLTPEKDTPREYLEQLIDLVEGMGARPILMTPQEHDLSVAAVSHLPHLLATTLINSLFDFESSERMALLAAGGFKDTTRIAAGNPDMWLDIFMTNQNFILQTIKNFKQRLDEFQIAIENKEDTHIYRLLERARKLKTGMPVNAKGYLPELWEIVVTVPDKPGIIGEMAVILGNEGINIYDIEIMRVREGEGGTIRLAFASQAQQEQAVGLLMTAGIPTKKR